MKYIVEFSGTIDVEADCELEAECTAATMCRPDNCRVIAVQETGDETAAKGATVQKNRAKNEKAA